MTALHLYELNARTRPSSIGAGPTRSPHLVLLHGATLDHCAWTPQVNAFSAAFQMVASDLRRHGDSPGRSASTVRDTIALDKHLSAQRIDLNL
jgi:pimeloyl-ACP methyl ester carboxylesterase